MLETKEVIIYSSVEDQYDDCHHLRCKKQGITLKIKRKEKIVAKPIDIYNWNYNWTSEQENPKFACRRQICPYYANVRFKSRFKMLEFFKIM